MNADNISPIFRKFNLQTVLKNSGEILPSMNKATHSLMHSRIYSRTHSLTQVTQKAAVIISRFQYDPSFTDLISLKAKFLMQKKLNMNYLLSFTLSFKAGNLASNLLMTLRITTDQDKFKIIAYGGLQLRVAVTL